MPDVVPDDPTPALSDDAIEAWAAVLIDLAEKRLTQQPSEPKADLRQAA